MASVLAGCFAPAARAQVLYGSIVGAVTDPTQAAVVRASVTITNAETGLSRQASTDESGYYSAPNLPAGSYDVAVTATGFKPVTRRGVSVRTNTVTSVDISLEVGALTESITVEASAAVLQTNKTDVNANIEPRALVNLPLTAYRNYQTLINLVPGATPARFQNAVIDTPGRSLTTNINGQERGANNTRVDGAANVLVTMPHHVVYVPPVESIQEVNISTNSFDAEQGMTGGAAVTVITKSGTNEFHGVVHNFHQNNAMRAFLWDERRVGLDKKPKTIRNILGGNLGGPIKRNKLFFSGNWEGMFERVGFSSLFSVPPMDYRRGDFTRRLGAPILDARGQPIMAPTTEGGFTQLRQGMVFDPLTGNPDGTGRAVFSSNGQINVIPASRLNGPMMKLLALVPEPNQPGDQNNYFNAATQRFNRNNVDAKVNWNRTDNHQLWFKYSAMDALVSAEAGLGKAGGPPLSAGGLGTGNTLTQIAAIGQTYAVSPTFLLDGTLGWTRFGQDVAQPGLDTRFGLDVLGIPGTNGPDPREGGMPSFAIGGYTTLGYTETWNPLFRNDQSYTFNGNASWMKGSHEIRFGVDFVHHLMNHWQPELGGGPRGQFSFGSAITALNPSAIRASVGFDGATPSFERDWNAVAAFLLGLPSSAGKSPQYIKMTSFENQYALYLRDRWRVTPKLTLNLGLRWELYPTRTRAAGMGIESYDPATNEVLIGGRGGIPRDVGVGYSKRLFAPRAGIAYMLGRSTVIRTGYGLTYIPHPWGAQALRGWYPLTIIGTFAGANAYLPVTSDPNYVAAGVPNKPLGPDVGIVPIPGPDISRGRIPLPPAADMGYPVANRTLTRGYIQSWNFIIQRQLPGQLVASLGYVGTAMVNGFAFLDINASQIPGSGNAGRPLFGPFRRTAPAREFNGRTSSNYHSLQFTMDRRVARGLFLKAAYTFSHAIDIANYGDWTTFSWNAASVFHRNRATAAHDVPHIFQFGYVYELPFGAGHRIASSGVAKALLGGWQVNGIFSAYQGRPYMLSSSGASLNMPGNAQTPDQVKLEVAKLGKAGDDGAWFDTTAFAPVTEVRFGAVGRNTMRAPGVINADLSVFRNFQVMEKLKLEFRAESFNLSNTPHFANPNGNVNSALFGRIFATQSTDVMGRSREYRLALRLSF
jgi:hypothetical protein